MNDRQSMSILVVDDMQSWRDLLGAILEDAGYEVVLAGSIEDAQGSLRTREFAMAILDMRLLDSQAYDIGGMRLLADIKKSNPSTRAIILTGFPNELQRAKALDFYGADGYLEKAPAGQPFDMAYFSQFVSDLLKINSKTQTFGVSS